MIEFKQETNVYHHITRNDRVYVFYKKLDIFGFLSAYVFHKWFEKYTMSSSLVLIPIGKDGLDKHHLKSLESDYNKTIVIFIDIDLTYKDILEYAAVSKKIDIIDNKESTVFASQKYARLLIPSSDKEKVRFLNKTNNSILYVTYKSLTNDDYPDEFIDLEEFSYDKFTTSISDYHLRLPQLYGNNFEAVDLFFKDKQINLFRQLKTGKAAVGFATSQAVDVCYNSSYICKFNNRVFNVVNFSPMYSLFVLSILNSESKIDVSLTYEEVAGDYYYKATTRKQDINLFEVFEDYEVFGDKDCVWFKTKDDILNNIPLYS